MLITAQMIRNEIAKRKAQIMDRAYQRRNIGAKRSARYVDRLADKPIDHTGTQAKFKRLQKAEGMKEFFGSSFTEGARPKKKDHKAKVRPATTQESSFVEGAKPSAKNAANGKKYYEGPFKSKFWNKWYRQNKYAAGRGLRFMGRNAIPLAIAGGIGAGAYYAHKKNQNVGKMAKGSRSLKRFHRMGIHDGDSYHAKKLSRLKRLGYKFNDYYDHTPATKLAELNGFKRQIVSRVKRMKKSINPFC